MTTMSYIKFIGSNGSTNFRDNTGRVWANSGSPTISTAQKKYGESSGLFTGSDWIYTPETTDLYLGTNDFTIDLWVRPTSLSFITLFTNLTSITLILRASSITAYFKRTDGGTWSVFNDADFTVNTWYHIAIVRKDNDYVLYVNGVGGTSVTALGTLLPASSLYPTEPFFYLGRAFTTPGLSGYVDEFRISNTALWTENFTPPAETVHTFETGITNRTALDITNRTAKAFFNVADWTRIYGNTETLCSIAEITFDTVSAPSMTSFPTVTDFNTLLANIERARLQLNSSLSYVRSNYATGNKPAPSYVDVNLWESVIASLIEEITPRKARAGIAKCGAGITRGNKFRRY